MSDQYIFTCLNCGSEFESDNKWSRDCPVCFCSESGKLESQKIDGETYIFRGACGAWIGVITGRHLGLSRCYCGWSESGGDGYRELVEYGETIEPEL